MRDGFEGPTTAKRGDADAGGSSAMLNPAANSFPTPCTPSLIPSSTAPPPDPDPVVDPDRPAEVGGTYPRLTTNSHLRFTVRVRCWLVSRRQGREGGRTLSKFSFVC